MKGKIMIDRENEFFGEIKNENFDEENTSSSGINYGEKTDKSGLKNIVIAISAGAVVAAILAVLLTSKKKSSDINNLAEIPTISQPSEPFKITPDMNQSNEVFENASIYENPNAFDLQTKEFISQNQIAKPSQPAPLPKKVAKKPSVKKAPVKPVAKTERVEKKAPVITSYKEEKFVEKKTGIPGEVELSLTPNPLTKTGIWNIQLVSTSTESAAKTEWDNLSKKYPSILGNKSHTINKTEVNGKTYYRLRVSNIATSEQATDICNQLKAYKVSCFVVK